MRYALKAPWRDGTTHVVLAPRSGLLRALITPAGRGKGSKSTASTAQGAEQPGLPRHVALRWAQRLKRVFGIEIETCAWCGARLKVLASIEEPGVIARILADRDRASGTAQPQRALHAARAPRQSAV